MTSQLQRAAVSIPTNIAEGAGRKTDRELVRFIRIAGGSANESETLVHLARRLNYIDQRTQSALESQIRAIRRQLAGLENSVLKKSNR